MQPIMPLEFKYMYVYYIYNDAADIMYRYNCCHYNNIHAFL